MRINTLLLTIAAIAAFSSCQSKTTKIAGEFPAGTKADSIRIWMMDGNEMDTIYRFAVKGDKVDYSVPTDKMKLGMVLVSYDGGASTGYFIPEGGTIAISMGSDGSLNFKSGKKNSLTDCYSRMNDELMGLSNQAQKDYAALEAKGAMTQDQKDSANAAREKMLMAKMKEQSISVIKKNKDNAIGLMAIYNLMSLSKPEEVKEYVAGMKPVIRDRQEIKKFLENNAKKQ